MVNLFLYLLICLFIFSAIDYLLFCMPSDAARVISQGALSLGGNTMTAVGVEMSSTHQDKSCAVIVHDIQRYCSLYIDR